MISELTLIKRLKKYMFENNLTQKELSQQLNIDRSHLSKIFNNHYSISSRTRYKIEKVLGLDEIDEN